MAKVSQMTDDGLIELIEKHENILKKLYREKSKRKINKDEMNFAEKNDSSSNLDISDGGHNSNSFTFNLKEEGIEQDDILNSSSSKANSLGEEEDEQRVTQLLTLTPKQLEELNQSQEQKRKKEKKLKEEAEKTKDKPKSRFS